MRKILLFSILLCFLLGLEFDLSLGNAYSFSSDIKINSNSSSNESINLTSRPNTRGFKSPQYYSIRIRKSNKELELIHHKLYFENNLPDNITHFEFTDGYNLLLMNFLYPFSIYEYIDIFSLRFGLGTVVVHPDVTIDEVRYYKKGGGLIPTLWKSGYQIGGISSQISLNFNKNISNKFSFNSELKVSYALTDVDLETDYTINIPNTSIHFLMGISFGK
tara:strand:- start:302 stop:958 length:657 start_codon:yes stop_codon:yes gene_type:complete